MPTKIVLTASDPKNGDINKQDLTSIIQDYDNLVEITSTASRTVKKTDTVTIPVSILKHLLEKVNETEIDHSNINIKFGVTLPDQKDCKDDTIDISNHLTVVLVIEKNGTEQVNENDFVITPGFKEHSPNKEALGVCCGTIHPGS